MQLGNCFFIAYSVNHLELKACLWGIHGERGQETLPGHGVEISWAAPFTRPSRVRRQDPRHYPIDVRSGGSVVPDWLRPGRIREFWLGAVQAVSGSLVGCCSGTTWKSHRLLLKRVLNLWLAALQMNPWALIGCCLADSFAVIGCCSADLYAMIGYCPVDLSCWLGDFNRSAIVLESSVIYVYCCMVWHISNLLMISCRSNGFCIINISL